MKKLLIIALIAVLSSCNKFIDVIPDNVADLEMAFNLRSTAERYLYTCYSYLPKHGDVWNNPVFLAGDEVASSYTYRMNDGGPFSIAMGLQNTSKPINNSWNSNLFIGIRECNIFLDNVGKVPDLREEERIRWIAEVTYLNAFLLFWLLRMYGQIPISDKNLSLGAGVDEVRIHRQPIDDCFDYIVALIDKATPDLPEIIESKATEEGRITQAIALSMKAYILVTAASPLFNGNNDYLNFNSLEGKPFFNSTFSNIKWEKAAKATDEAIRFVESRGFGLYEFPPTEVPLYTLKPTTLTRMSIRNAVTQPWNKELIWGDPNSIQNMTVMGTFMPRLSSVMGNNFTDGSHGPTINMAQDFYTKNGVPINEDTNWEYAKRHELRTATAGDVDDIQPGYQTAILNYDREDRFYATLGFDGGTWYGQDVYDDTKSYVVYAKKGQIGAGTALNHFSLTGYFAKKLIHYQSVMVQGTFQPKYYPWPVMRLSDLYLLHAEATNEFSGPNSEAYKYVDLVRKRAGLDGVVQAWAEHSINPNKPSTKDGLRSIIQQERKIELALEGHRLWDQRRWKTAAEELSKPIMGWDVSQSLALSYYRPVALVQRSFQLKDYFWPIRQSDLVQNPNLLQNPGW